MEPTTRSWTSYIQYPHGGDNFKDQVCGKLSGATLHFLIFPGPSLGLRYIIASVGCRNHPTSVSSQGPHTVCLLPQCTQVRQTTSLSPISWRESWVIWTHWGSSFPTPWWFQCGCDPAPAEKIWARICCNFPKVFVFHGQYWLHELAEMDFSSRQITQPWNCLHHSDLTCAVKKRYCKRLCSVYLVGLIEKRNGLSGNRAHWAHFFPSHLQRFCLLSTVTNKTRTVGWAK